MTSSGSAYSRFQRSLATGNLHLIRAAAAELPRIGLDDALRVCTAIRDREPAGFERAALRWLGRFSLERARSIDDVRAAADAFERVRVGDRQAEEQLRALSRL